MYIFNTIIFLSLNQEYTATDQPYIVVAKEIFSRCSGHEVTQPKEGVGDSTLETVFEFHLESRSL